MFQPRILKGVHVRVHLARVTFHDSEALAGVQPGGGGSGTAREQENTINRSNQMNQHISQSVSLAIRWSPFRTQHDPTPS